MQNPPYVGEIKMKKISEEIREYDKWLNRKYAEREDKDNALPVGITNTEFCEWAIRILLGDGWYVTTPIGNDQINEVAMEEIIFQKCGVDAKDRKGKEKMNETLENASKSRVQIRWEEINKLWEIVLGKPTTENSNTDEEAKIIINGKVDRKLYAKICTLCLSEDGVNVIYEKGNKEEARACFENEMKPVAIYEYLESTYGLSIRTANCLTCEYQRLYNTLQAPKAKLERWLHELLENDGEKLVKVRNLGRKSAKEVMEKVGNRK